MPIYRLSSRLLFPPVEHAEADGLLAVGGDLSPERLLLAYSSGLFPWYSPGEPILWWSPDPRCILELDELNVSRSLAKVLRQGHFSVTFNQAFAEVVAACAESARGEGVGTWISAEMRHAYLQLHRRGFAHSVECWQDERLVGGLYGVALGRTFCGESMFHRENNASKVALVALVRRLQEHKVSWLDCQISNPHLLSLGARQISRADFLRRLRLAGIQPSITPPGGLFP